MQTKAECYYCERDASFQELLYELCDLKVSKVFFCKDQTLPGRCTIMLRNHYEELYDIPMQERNEYINDVCILAQTLTELYGADKINYGIYGDTVRHVHFTLCPKYTDKLGWGRPFEMFPENRVFLSAEQYEQEMARLKQALLCKRGMV